MRRNILLVLVAVLPFAVLFGCGGGGGGAPPADIQGRVLLVSTQQPLGGATVNINGAQVTTDATAGTFVLRGVSSASKQIVISGTGIVTLTQNLPTLTPNTVNNLGDIYVVDTTSGNDYSATASGTVVDSTNQHPVAGALVRLNGQAVTTGASGAFSFSNLPSGLGGTTNPVGLIRATGYEDKPIVLDLPLGKSPPDNNLGAIPISPPVGGIPNGPTNINGTVTAQGATDNSGTTVTLIGKTSGQTVGTETTAADGKYGFYVAAGTYTLHFNHTGFTSKSQDVTLARPDQVQTFNVTLTP